MKNKKHTWKLENKIIPKGTILPTTDKNGNEILETYKEDYPIEVLTKNDNVWMSNSKMEVETNKEFIGCAKGDVLIAGLGMGYTIEQIQNKTEVKSITVIEIDNDLIRYLLTKKKFDDKVKIINKDIWDYLSLNIGHTYDVIWLDIWLEICSDNVVDMYPLNEVAKKLLNRNGKVLIWNIKGCEEMVKDYFRIKRIETNTKQKIINSELLKRGMKI